MQHAASAELLRTIATLNKDAFSKLTTKDGKKLSVLVKERPGEEAIVLEEVMEALKAQSECVLIIQLSGIALIL